MKLKLLLIATLLFSFSTTTEQLNDTNSIEPEIIKFKEAKNPPLAPGCESDAELEERKKCSSRFIQRHIAQKMANYMTSSAKTPKTTKINIEFVIDKNGKTTSITATGGSETMNKNTIKVVESLPDMKPGTKDGKPVNVSFTTYLQIDSAK
jgi:hypothetical protein